jgi:hypothetical protein
MKSNLTPFAYAQASKARLQNSFPLAVRYLDEGNGAYRIKPGATLPH